MTATSAPRAVDFEPVRVDRVHARLTRPSLSYWQDAWLRLERNRRAFYSMYLIVGLLAFTVAGPWLWPIDPADQDLDQVSEPPGADRTVRVIDAYAPWAGASLAQAERLDAPLALAEPPTTQAVRLVWKPIAGAHGYHVYRNIFAPDPRYGLGLPVGAIESAVVVFFEDRLDLAPRRYWYAVVALDADGNEHGPAISTEARVERVITPYQAVQRGLVAAEADARLGATLELPLHPLGTDYLGRDMLARLMHGARVSLFIGLVAPALYVLLGIFYGSVAGFLAGRTDQLLMRFADFVVALPFLLFMILFKIAFGIGPGESGIFPMLVALVLLGWPTTARLVRGQILQIREEGYIGASRLLGASTSYLVLRHMIPNTLGVVLVTLTFAVPSAIFTEAFLSFIGMGVAPPTPSWGSMCNEGIKTMLSHPHELIFPALFISLTVLAFNLLGDGLRDALDARMRSRE